MQACSNAVFSRWHCAGRIRRRGAAQAQISDDVVKIGVLTDMSSLYADVAGEGSVVAAQMAVEEFGDRGAAYRSRSSPPTIRTRPTSARNIARQWYRHRKVDAIVDVPNSASALAVQADHARQGQGVADVRPGHVRSDGRCLLADRLPLGLRHLALAVGTGRAVVSNGGNSWFFITADYAFGHSLEARCHPRGEGAGRRGDGQRAASAQQLRLLLVPASGAGLGRTGDRSGQCRHRHDQLDQAGGRVRHRQGRPDAGGSALFITDVHALGLQTAQGWCSPTGFYWDMDDETRAWSPSSTQKTGQQADDGPGRRLFRRPALPEGGRGAEDRRRH